MGDYNVDNNMKELIIIIILILLNGVLSMAEMALVSARKGALSADEKRGSRSARAALKLAAEPDNFLSTVQIGITVIGILTGLYSGDALADNFGKILVGWGMGAQYAYPAAQVIIVVTVTYLTLVLGELLPKRIGMSMAERIAKAMARPMQLLSTLTKPLVWILSKSTSGLFRLFGFRNDESKVTEEEIKSLIEEGTRDGEVQEVEQDIVERVFLMGDLRITQLMTHRTEMAAIDLSMNAKEIEAVLRESLQEAYPVVDRNFDNVKGVVYLRDLVFDLHRADFSLTDLLAEPVCFHENMSVYKALERLRELHIGQALIYDEFGSCLGMITLRDITDGLIGTIDSQQDDPDIVERRDGDGWLVDGQCSFYDFLVYFDSEHLYSTDMDYSTVGGLVLEMLEQIPQCGDKVTWEEFCFEVLDMDGVRIDKILVTREVRSADIVTEE